MENNFFVGEVCHTKKINRDNRREKIVLYSDDNVHYLDLVRDVTYTCDKSSSDYVMRESLEKADINDFREDYLYLLSRHNDSKNSVLKKKKKWYNIKS